MEAADEAPAAVSESNVTSLKAGMRSGLQGGTHTSMFDIFPDIQKYSSLNLICIIVIATRINLQSPVTCCMLTFEHVFTSFLLHSLIV